MTQQSIASRVRPPMTNAEILAQTGVEAGHVIYSVHVRFPDGGLAQQFPGLTVCGVAIEVMERLRNEYPGASVGLIRYGLGIENRAEAEALTERMKETIIEAATRNIPAVLCCKSWNSGRQPTETPRHTDRPTPPDPTTERGLLLVKSPFYREVTKCAGS